jgi:hypothetical protein
MGVEAGIPLMGPLHKELCGLLLELQLHCSLDILILPYSAFLGEAEHIIVFMDKMLEWFIN